MIKRKVSLIRGVIFVLERQFRTIPGTRDYHAARLIARGDGLGFREDMIDLRYYSCPCEACIKGGDCLVLGDWDRKNIVPL